MRRKTIGCLLADLEGNFNTIIWREIHRAAQKAGCRLVVFEGRALDDPTINDQHGFIYELAQRAKVDGFLFSSSQLCRFVNDSRYQAFCQPFLKRGLPLASLGLPILGAMNILIDGRKGLRTLIEHLVLKHGYHRLAFVKGPENNAEANERYQVYLDVLAQYGIPFDADLVEPGDFSTTAGFLAYQRLEERGVVCDVIICINDDTAAGAYRYINENEESRHKMVTEHITGFDNTLVSQLNQPSITTVAQPFSRMTDEAFSWLKNPTGTLAAKESFFLPTEMIVRSSCGCDYAGRMSFSDELLLLSVRNFRVHQTMQTFSLDELYDEIDQVLRECKVQNCYIVMYPDAVINDGTADFPPKALLIYLKQGDLTEHYTIPQEFSTSDLLPETAESSDDWSVRIVKPLFFRSEQMGYVVFERDNHNTRDFEAIRGQIGNMLKIIHLLLRQKEIEGRLAKAVGDLQEFNRTLNILSIRDELTGLLNRRGFFDAVQNELDVSGENAQEFLVIFADIDGMKSINDVYGHEEGDAAIRGTAEMLRKVFRADDIIARMGGDEFIVYARHAAPSFFEKVQERAELVLAEIRAVSPKPYRLSVSLGCACFDPHTPLSLSELLREADQHLYEEKRRRKEEAKAILERG